MCGIYCCISHHDHSHQPGDNFKELLHKRGPDSIRQLDMKIGHAHLSFTSSVLSLRGKDVVQQPLVDDRNGSVLCWNGEAWELDEVPVTGNDSLLVFDLLSKCPSQDGRRMHIVNSLHRIHGPFAFVFLDAFDGTLYFGRDSLGRRSLVQTTTDNGDIIISSIMDPTAGSIWTEVEADGIYYIPTRPLEALKVMHIPRVVHTSVASMMRPSPDFNMSIPDSNVSPLAVDSASVARLELLLLESMRVRTANLPGSPSTPLAVLFSGGLDSTLLAYVAHLVLPLETPVDLLNVAFQNPRIHPEDLADPYSLCPDRMTGLSAFKTLRLLCAGRNFRFVAINIPFTETTIHRQTIMSLMHPHNTEMDLSIASALYFASRGIGTVATANDSRDTYTTPARVLLSGLGADELFGGYGRHAMAFNRRGHSGLLEQMELDFSRLGKRNLGRDDRVTSHWGREVRYPFLDERLVAWAIAIPVWEKCDFGAPFLATADPAGSYIEAGKKVLRLLAWRYGMKDVAHEKKRAIQFGTRTAKMQNGKTKGTDRLPD